MRENLLLGLIMSKYKKIDLWGEIYPDLPKKVTLRPFALESGENFPAVLVLPGGGYGFCSEQEGDPVACWLNSLGISAFVLDYSVEPSKHPQPLNDARRAMQYLRANASKYNIDSNRVGVIGFSAGGHLAASLSNFHNEKNLDVNDDTSSKNGINDTIEISSEFLMEMKTHPEDSVSDLKRMIQERYEEEWGLLGRRLDRDKIRTGWELICFNRKNESNDNASDQDPRLGQDSLVMSYHLFLRSYDIQHGDIIHAVVRRYDD